MKPKPRARTARQEPDDESMADIRREAEPEGTRKPCCGGVYKDGPLRLWINGQEVFA